MPLSNRKRPTASMSSWRASGISTIGKPERFGVCTPSESRQSRTSDVLRQRSARIASPRRSFTSSPTSAVASDATGDGPEYKYGGGGGFSCGLRCGGGGRETRRGAGVFSGGGRREERG